jgi:hypothetical protein
MEYEWSVLDSSIPETLSGLYTIAEMKENVGPRPVENAVFRNILKSHWSALVMSSDLFTM